jgi:hypothetical protein
MSVRVTDEHGTKDVTSRFMGLIEKTVILADKFQPRNE